MKKKTDIQHLESAVGNLYQIIKVLITKIITEVFTKTVPFTKKAYAKSRVQIKDHKEYFEKYYDNQGPKH